MAGVGDHPGSEIRLSLQPDGSRLVTGFDDTHQCQFWAEIEEVMDIPTPEQGAFADDGCGRGTPTTSRLCSCTSTTTSSSRHR